MNANIMKMHGLGGHIEGHLFTQKNIFLTDIFFKSNLIKTLYECKINILYKCYNYEDTNFSLMTS